MIEIKVDVHTVHPSSSSVEKQIAKTPLARGAYGSWCTPESTPAHHALKQTSSNIETKSQIQEDAQQNKAKVFFRDQKVQLFSSHVMPKYIPGSEIELADDDTELKDFKKSILKNNSSEKILSIKDSAEADIETLKSPEPKLSTWEKNWKIVSKILAFCDPYLPIDPQGRAYIVWLLLVTFCYSYNAWCIVLRATFPYQTPLNLPLWMTADYLCDFVYLLDVAFVKPRLMFLRDGFFVDEPAETRKNYRRKLQYKFDLLSLLPLDLLYFYYGTNMVILRLPRVLKLQSFWEFNRAMDRKLSSPYVVRIGKSLFYIFYLIHLNACAYYALSDYIGLGSNGWVYDNQGNAYIRCFYFATKTATSIGKNPKPENTIEYLFMTAAWLMGVFVFALLIGQIRDIIATATRSRTEYRKRMDRTIRYLRLLNMPSSLQRRVAQWFNYTWRQQRCFNESGILNSLPYNMKRDISLLVHMSTLSKVQLFRDCSDSLLRDLVLQLKPVSYLPGDVVVRKGDVGHQMYIIKSGECCVMSPDDSEVVATLTEGSVFGEISLLGIDGLRRRTATVRARGYANLFALSKSDLDAALAYHKEAATILRLRADQIISENAARQAKRRIHEMEAKKSADDRANSVRRRRVSIASDNDNDGKKQRSESEMSKRRLSAVSEKKNRKRPSVSSACESLRAPLPTIVLSSE